MWEELNPSNPLDRRCPYCGEVIGIRALFTGEADTDHIIPYSQSLDDSAGNKIIAHRSCNRQKGNKTPYECWGHDDARWETISVQVARMHRSKQWRFGPGARERLDKDGGFLAPGVIGTTRTLTITRRMPPATERTGRTRCTEPFEEKCRALARGGMDGVARLTRRPTFHVGGVSRRAVIGGLKP